MKPIVESTGAGMADGELVTYTYKFVETKIKVDRAPLGVLRSKLKSFRVLCLFGASVIV